jgi:hypothetical protein
MENTNLKAELVKKGWLMKDAAKVLCVTPTYLSYVAHGHMKSRRLTRGILALPQAPNKRKQG